MTPRCWSEWPLCGLCSPAQTRKAGTSRIQSGLYLAGPCCLSCAGLRQASAWLCLVHPDCYLGVLSDSQWPSFGPCSHFLSVSEFLFVDAVQLIHWPGIPACKRFAHACRRAVQASPLWAA